MADESHKLSRLAGVKKLAQAIVRRISGVSSNDAPTVSRVNKRLHSSMYETGEDDIQSEISKLKEEVDEVSKEVKDLEEKEKEGSISEREEKRLDAKRAERDALNYRIAAAYAKETQLSKERTDAPLWDVLAQIPQRATSIPAGTLKSQKSREESGKPEKTGGGALTDTKGWPAPDNVVRDDNLAPDVLSFEDDSPWFTKIENERFPNANIDEPCSNEAAVSAVLNSFLRAAVHHCASATLIPELVRHWTEHPDVLTGFRPDFVIENGTFGYVLVIELKPEWKWGVHWDRRHGEDNFPPTTGWLLEEKIPFDQLKDGVEASPIRQQLTYMLGLRLRCGILTTYTHWWFLEYEGSKTSMTLKTSRPIAYNDQDPSMAQYLANHLVKCCNSLAIPDTEIPDAILEQLAGWQNFKKQLKGFAERNPGGGGGGGDAAGGGGSSSGNGPGPSDNSGDKPPKKGKKKKNGKKKKGSKNGTTTDTPVITETLGTSRTGVSWKVDYLGYTSVVKVADVFKQPDLIEELKQEQHVYTTLSKLQGSIIPHFIGLCDFQCGRLGIATLYAGEPLQRYIKDTECDHDVRLEIARKCISNLDSIHEQHVHHGDIRAENIVVDEDGTPRFIDFAFSEIHNATPEEYARERSSLIEMLKKELKLDETFIAQTNDMSLDIQMKFQ